MKSAFLVYNIVDFSLIMPQRGLEPQSLGRMLYPVELSGLIYFQNKTPSWRLR